MELHRFRHTTEALEYAVMEFEKSETNGQPHGRSDDPVAVAGPNSETQSDSDSITPPTEAFDERSPVERTTLSHQQQNSLEDPWSDRRKTLGDIGDPEPSNPECGINSQYPCSTSQPKYKNQIETIHTPSIFEEVYNGEVFIKNCISASLTNVLNPRKLRLPIISEVLHLFDPTQQIFFPALAYSFTKVKYPPISLANSEFSKHSSLSNSQSKPLSSTPTFVPHKG